LTNEIEALRRGELVWPGVTGARATVAARQIALERHLPNRVDRPRLLVARTHAVPEGAGALALAAAQGRTGTTVCIVSGGNVDPSVLTRVLSGETPS
jgi:hypothetical protein